MYSFGQRTDTTVYDEPLYAAYLQQSGYDRPYRQAVLDSQSADGEEVMQMLKRHAEEKHVYAKQMGKFQTCVSRKWLGEGVHVILVRDPVSVVASFSEVLDATLEETCYPSLCCIASELRARGKKPIVVLSEDLVQRPAATLKALCHAMGLEFDNAMLRWPAGPKPYDGCWASYWYRSVHQSSGWDRPTSAEKATPTFSASLRPLLQECYAMFALLQPYAINPADALPLPVSTAAATSRESSVELSARTGSLRLHGEGTPLARDTSFAHSETRGTHVYEADPRNADILIGIRDGVSLRFTMEWRPVAKVSVLDAGYMLGDGVWEGIRLHKGVATFVREHLARLYEGAKALDMQLDISQQQLLSLIYKCVDANDMKHASGVHIRLMVTRGLKPTPYQNPTCIIGSPTIVIVPEWKLASDTPKVKGIRLSTVHVRRGPADVQDQAWNSHSKLNCISACIAANKAGADEGLMLDPLGFVATCNSVNFFIVVRKLHSIRGDSDNDGVAVWAPTTKYQLHGITRANILHLCEMNNIPCEEKDFTLTSVYSAQEAFVTGTFAGVIPVVSVDGRTIGNGTRGPITSELQQLYMAAMDEQAEQGRVECDD